MKPEDLFFSYMRGLKKKKKFLEKKSTTWPFLYRRFHAQNGRKKKIIIRYPF